jgi:Carboxypeptidase regulatory-like domain
MGRPGSRLKNGIQFRERWCAPAILLIAGWVVGILVALPISAQAILGSVALTGVVRTAAGAPVAAAKVIAIFTGIYQKRRQAFTDATGHLTLRVPAQGSYNVAVQLPGRAPTVPPCRGCRRAIGGRHGIGPKYANDHH